MATHPSAHTYLQPDVKLEGSNYREWFVSVHMLFDSLDLLSHINGTPAPFIISNEKVVDWDVANGWARGVISQSVMIEIRLEMHTLLTSLAIWTFGHFQRSSYARSHATSWA